MAEVKKLESGGVMISTSPTDSYILDEEEVNAVAGAMNGTSKVFEKSSDDISKVSERSLNDAEKVSEKSLNGSRKGRGAMFATMAKMSIPSETPSDILNANKDVVRLLRDKNFIRSNSPYGKKGNPNFFSVPNQITDAVNRQLGTDYKNGYMAKVWLSMKYQERFSPVFVKFLCVIWFCSLVLVGWWFGFRRDAPVTPGSPIQKEKFDFRREVEHWQTKNHYYFSGWRLSHEIRNCKVSSLQELDRYLNNQRTIQGASFTELQKW
ncbi:MAG: hypothetical protein MJZ66_04105 [Bacteroidales bacterium]|nr:hypothetical protein [Bacteroidales bacterium]